MSPSRELWPSLAPRVSIVVPTYNRLSTLCELMEALSRQTYWNFEVVVVNDAGKPIEAIASLYPELDVRIVNLPVNRRQAHALNEGIARSRGELIMFCDDDDMLMPCHVQRMVEALRDADLAYADAEIYRYHDVGGLRVPTSRRLLAVEFDADLNRQFLTIVPAGTLMRRTIFQALGPLDETLPAYWDWDFFLRVADAGLRIRRVPVASVLYAFGEGNFTARHENNRPYLERFMAKHGLSDLKTSNFELVTTEPCVVAAQAQSRRVWDGRPTVSRLVAGDGLLAG